MLFNIESEAISKVLVGHLKFDSTVSLHLCETFDDQLVPKQRGDYLKGSKLLLLYHSCNYYE